MSRRRIRNPRTRRHALLLALVRSGWRCVHCGAALMLAEVLGDDLGWWKARTKCHGDGLLVATLDHVVPLAVGGDRATEHNLVASCKPCNHGRADNPRTLEHAPGGAVTRISWGGREFVRVGRAWEPA